MQFLWGFKAMSEKGQVSWVMDVLPRSSLELHLEGFL